MREHIGTRVATPAEMVGAGHFHPNVIAARQEQQAAHLAAKAEGIADKARHTKRAQRCRPLHDVVPPAEAVKISDKGAAKPQRPKYRRMSHQRHGRRR